MASPLPKEAPAPWKCRAETYWLVLQLQNPLPVDIYDDLEARHPACTTAGFKGGYGIIMVVRYSETPVGPYDELLCIPGNFNVRGGPDTGSAKMRVTRIYVSQKETTYNGRRNWNIPKHLARFEFSAPPVAKGGSPPKEQVVAVYPPDSDSSARPFFKATFRPVPYLPAFPLSTKYLPLDMTLVQPPIPASDSDPILCGTEKWRKLQGSFASNRAYMTKVEYEDDYEKLQYEGWWPRVKPWSWGMWLEDAEAEFTEPEEWTA